MNLNILTVKGYNANYSGNTKNMFNRQELFKEIESRLEFFSEDNTNQFPDKNILEQELNRRISLKNNIVSRNSNLFQNPGNNENTNINQLKQQLQQLNQENETLFNSAISRTNNNSKDQINNVNKFTSMQHKVSRQLDLEQQVYNNTKDVVQSLNVVKQKVERLQAILDQLQIVANEKNDQIRYYSRQITKARNEVRNLRQQKNDLQRTLNENEEQNTSEIEKNEYLIKLYNQNEYLYSPIWEELIFDEDSKYAMLFTEPDHQCYWKLIKCRKTNSGETIYYIKNTHDSYRLHAPRHNKLVFDSGNTRYAMTYYQPDNECELQWVLEHRRENIFNIKSYGNYTTNHYLTICSSRFDDRRRRALISKDCAYSFMFKKK